MAAVISALVTFGLRRHQPRGSRYLEPATAEFALISTLYCFWRLARKLPLATMNGALERAHDIVAIQNALHLPTELSLQRFVMRYDWLTEASTWYYASVHVISLLVFLVWLFVRHRDHYPHWRNGLAIVTLCCLVIRFARVAPPRFLTELGYVDLSRYHGPSVYGSDVMTGASDQYAAMPSIHVAWAAVISFGIVAASTSRWRWLGLLHVIVTVLVVAATGNHWWMDGIVAIALLAAGLRLDTVVRRRWPRTDPALGAEEPAHQVPSANGSRVGGSAL